MPVTKTKPRSAPQAKQPAQIVPHLWFDQEAKDAAEFYASIFPDSRVTSVTTLPDTPSGDAEVVAFELAGQPFLAISAGPLFRFNPSISFILNFDPSRDPEAAKHLDETWAKLAYAGKALMPLQEYPFSKRYGWVEDRFGVSWQLILTDPNGEPRPFLTPAIMFTGKLAGRAEEAIRHYTSVFDGSKVGTMARHPKGGEFDREGTIMFADFQLAGQWFAAMDSAYPHGFMFNEAISFLVNCEDQKEVDRFWSKLSADPAAEQCGWLKDKFGLSWQIAPRQLGEMLRTGTKKQVAAVTKAFLPMKKLELAPIEKAFRAANGKKPAKSKTGSKPTAKKPKPRATKRKT